MRLPYLASELNGIPVSDVEDLLVSLILDGKVHGKIDQACGGVVCVVMVLSSIDAELRKRWWPFYCVDGWMGGWCGGW